MKWDDPMLGALDRGVEYLLLKVREKKLEGWGDRGMILLSYLVNILSL